MVDTEQPKETRQQRREAARKEAKQAEPSLADQWLARRTPPQLTGDIHTVLLPSGDVVKARRIAVAEMLAMRQIPNRLLPIILEWVEAFNNAPDELKAIQDIEAINQANVEKYFEVLNHVWMTCIVEPIFVPDEKYKGLPGTIPLRWVDFGDMQYFFDWAQGVDESIVNWFRRRQNAGLGTPPTVPGVREDASGVPGVQDLGQPLAGVPDKRGGVVLGNAGGQKARGARARGVHATTEADGASA